MRTLLPAGLLLLSGLLWGVFVALVRRDGARLTRSAFVSLWLPGLVAAGISTAIMGYNAAYLVGSLDGAMLLVLALTRGHPAYYVPAQVLSQPPQRPIPQANWHTWMISAQPPTLRQRATMWIFLINCIVLVFAVVATFSPPDV